MIGIALQAAAALIALMAAAAAWRLERRLTRLKSGQDGMQRAAAELAAAVQRAEASVRALRQDGAEAAQELEEWVRRARAASDELRLLTPEAGGTDDIVRVAPQIAPRPGAEPARAIPAGLRPASSDLVATLRRVR